LMQCWLAATHTRLWAVPDDRSQYFEVIADQPGWFSEVGAVSQYGWRLEDVHVPPPSAAQCAAANGAASA